MHGDCLRAMQFDIEFLILKLFENIQLLLISKCIVTPLGVAIEGYSYLSMTLLSNLRGYAV